MASASRPDASPEAIPSVIMSLIDRFSDSYAGWQGLLRRPGLWIRNPHRVQACGSDLHGSDGGGSTSGAVWQSALMNHARRLDWRQWLAATRHPARKDGAIAVALLVLPWVIALVLWLLWLRRHHLDAGTAAAVIFGFAAVSVGLPVVWLAWVPIRNASRSSVPSGGDRAPGPTVLAGTPAGWQLAEVTDPFALEVHRPVQPEDPPPGLPELPVYVPREHDSALGSVVQAAAAGRSGIAVLVGGSSTGKTRACWEALGLLRDRPGPWRLWHPIDPTRPDAALRELSGIGPRTVVWLNEAQFYLDVPDGGPGERVAAGLRELLRDPDRAPVLVLATLWPRFWDTLTARPADGPDRHAQARELQPATPSPCPPHLPRRSWASSPGRRMRGWPWPPRGHRTGR